MLSSAPVKTPITAWISLSVMSGRAIGIFTSTSTDPFPGDEREHLQPCTREARP
jgi:hypothetical protein